MNVEPDQLKAAVRQVLREELERVMPELRKGPAFLSLRETAAKYRIGYGTLQRMVRDGKLELVTRGTARNGRPLRLVPAHVAESILGSGVTQ